jgi:hypothetical protein
MTREDEEKLREQLKARYDAFKQDLSGVENRAMPMDFGPESANQQALDRMRKERESVYQRYGVQPAAPALDAINAFNRSNRIPSKLVDGSKIDASMPVAGFEERTPVSKSDLKKSADRLNRFNELRSRFKK